VISYWLKLALLHTPFASPVFDAGVGGDTVGTFSNDNTGRKARTAFRFSFQFVQLSFLIAHG